MEENIESLVNLEENLIEYGYDMDDLPMVIQYWLVYCFARSVSRSETRFFALTTLSLCVGICAVSAPKMKPSKRDRTHVNWSSQKSQKKFTGFPRWKLSSLTS